MISVCIPTLAVFREKLSVQNCIRPPREDDQASSDEGNQVK
jgi:hypothetical protein